MFEEPTHPGPHEQAPEARPPQGKEDLPWVDLSPLSPTEVIDAYRYARERSRASWFQSGMDEVFGHLPSINPPRAIEIFTAGVDSRDPADRVSVAKSGWLFELAKVNHNAGVTLLDRLHRDSADVVREAAHKRLIALIMTTVPKGTSPILPEPYLAELINHQELMQRGGLILADVDSLLVANSSARDGEGVYDPGLEALAKLGVEVTREYGPILPPQPPDES